jgi:lysophospholipase L1-like esterase
MRLSRILAITVAAAAVAAGSLVATNVTANAVVPDYYLALGDSLSVGYQPLPTPGDTNQGYANQLYPDLRSHDHNLVLVDLGCSGETTGSMINGGCTDTDPNPTNLDPATHAPLPHNDYTTGSQLGDAVAFLKAHPGHVKYMTIDIGANDVDGCATGGSINLQCVGKGAETITENLKTILTALKAAGHNPPLSIGMVYYDPFLAEWLTGAHGQAVATASVTLLASLSATMSTEFAAYNFKIADVFDGFKTTNFTPTLSVLNPHAKLPTNVNNICTWTYMCSVGNIHANPTGYGVIAKAFAARV